jgi:hypothetical protein
VTVRPMVRWDTWWPCMQRTGQGSATLINACQLPLILHELCMGALGLGRLYKCWNSILWSCMQACRPQVMHVHAQPRQLWPHSCMLYRLLCYIKGLSCRLSDAGGFFPQKLGQLAQPQV